MTDSGTNADARRPLISSGTRRAPGTSATLAINEDVARRLKAGEEILHLGFGEVGLPVHPVLRDALVAAAGEARYGPVQGDVGLREAVASAYRRRGLETERDQVLVGPGSKGLLFVLMLALDGDLVLPRPSWVTYAAQAQLAGKHVARVPIPTDVGGIPDIGALETMVAAERRRGRVPRILLITNPDNPTGTHSSREALSALLAAAELLELTVISDEIYGDLVHDQHGFVSAAAVDPSCVITGGLSKSLALGGWRVGVVRFPATPRGERLLRHATALASEIWSALPAPIAQAARVAYEEPRELNVHVATSALLHAQVVTALHDAVVAAGADCRAPTAAFYLYPDLESQREALAARGINDAQGLARVLLDAYGIAVLPGDAFGDDPRALRFRIASSLLYGRDDSERWHSLLAAAAGAAARLPRVVEAAERLEVGLREIVTYGPS